jgi:hypothetical protein
MAKEDTSMSGLEIAEMLVKVARFLRFLGAERVVGHVRRRASLDFFRLLHLDVNPLPNQSSEAPHFRA